MLSSIVRGHLAALPPWRATHQPSRHDAQESQGRHTLESTRGLNCRRMCWRFHGGQSPKDDELRETPRRWHPMQFAFGRHAARERCTVRWCSTGQGYKVRHAHRSENRDLATSTIHIANGEEIDDAVLTDSPWKEGLSGQGSAMGPDDRSYQTRWTLRL